jgi:copper chaperone NosL
MNNQMSTRSRILVAFASLLFISLYFFPAWRIDLFAPQYPEGLVMFIWINNLSGDVEIINGLNHYIGMKHITVDMFPEFSFLKYVIAFFVGFGLIVAASGKRALLFIFNLLIIAGAILVLYDFYQWGYEYGHNLDPTAPIQIPGFSYQPPVLGHKRLLNFDAYSYPDLAGWMVVAGGLITIAVWFIEKRISYKKTVSAAISATLIILTFSLSSCSTEPEPFVVGQDDCHVCKMGLADFKFGGEVITNKGKIYKFDDLGCMTSFIESGSLEENDIAKTLVMNFENPNNFLDINTAWFVISPDFNSPMKSNAAGFISKEAAEKILTDKIGTIFNWVELIEKLK